MTPHDIDSRDATAPDAGFLTPANFLSLARIPLGLAFLAVHDLRWVAAIVAVGAATDLLDGLVARRTDTQSEIGALLDPFCDRVFVFLGLVSFLANGYLDWAGFVILILRDIFTGGVFVVTRLAGKHLPFQSRQGGRIATAGRIPAPTSYPSRHPYQSRYLLLLLPHRCLRLLLHS